MLPRRACYVMLLCATALGGPGIARAGRPGILGRFFHNPERSAYYPPQQEYVVVDPVPAGAGISTGHHAADGWRRSVVVAKPYPWGWFGARTHADRVTHLRYYGDTRDVVWRRGY